MDEDFCRLLSSARYWEVRKEDISSTSIKGWNGHLKQCSESSRQASSVRVLFKNGWGFASSFDNNIKNIALKALKSAKIMEAFSQKKDFFERKAIQKKVKTKNKLNPSDFSIEEKSKEIISNSKLNFKKVSSCEISYMDSIKNCHFQNSEGSDIHQNLTYSHYSVSTTAKKDNNLENFYVANGGQLGFEIIDTLEKDVEICRNKAINLLQAKVPIGGNFPVIADGILTDVFIHEALGHASEADNLLSSGTCLSGKENKKICSENITIVDDATKKGLWGSYFYDDEGTPSKRTEIIKNGVLNSYLHSRETSSLLNCDPTGNARAESSEFRPIVRMSNTYIEKGDSNQEEMIQEIKNGFFLKGSKGGTVDPARGSFTFSCQEGFLIKNGKIDAPVRGISLGGDTIKTLANIKMISNNYEKGFPGICGKNGQGVPVIGLCPAILISKAQVGGK